MVPFFPNVFPPEFCLLQLLAVLLSDLAVDSVHADLFAMAFAGCAGGMDLPGGNFAARLQSAEACHKYNSTN